MTHDGDAVTGTVVGKAPRTPAQRSALYRARKKRAARGYSWPPFAEGNTAAMTHGAYSEAKVEPVIARKLADLLGDDVPPYLRDAAYGPQIRAWARAEAEAELVYEWLQSLTPEERVTPRKAGTAAPVEVWRKMESHAASLRKDLGLTPLSKMKLGRSLQPVIDVAALMAQLADGDRAS